MSALRAPESDDVETLRVWLKRADYGNYSIGGAGSQVWGSLYSPERAQKPLIQQAWCLFRGLFWRRHEAIKSVDLVAMGPPRVTDSLTRWILREWIPFYHAIRWSFYRQARLRDLEAAHGDAPVMVRVEMRSFDFRKIFAWASTSVVTVASTVIPTLAIAVLAGTDGLERQILCIGGFTALFAAAFLLVRDAATSIVQVFTATVAFSAVLVVFVQKQ